MKWLEKWQALVAKVVLGRVYMTLNVSWPIKAIQLPRFGIACFLYLMKRSHHSVDKYNTMEMLEKWQALVPKVVLGWVYMTLKVSWPFEAVQLPRFGIA